MDFRVTDAPEDEEVLKQVRREAEELMKNFQCIRQNILRTTKKITIEKGAVLNYVFRTAPCFDILLRKA